MTTRIKQQFLLGGIAALLHHPIEQLHQFLQLGGGEQGSSRA